jgi:hypothetical protein
MFWFRKMNGRQGAEGCPDKDLPRRQREQGGNAWGISENDLKQANFRSLSWLLRKGSLGVLHKSMHQARVTPFSLVLCVLCNSESLFPRVVPCSPYLRGKSHLNKIFYILYLGSICQIEFVLLLILNSEQPYGQNYSHCEPKRRGGQNHHHH